MSVEGRHMIYACTYAMIKSYSGAIFFCITEFEMANKRDWLVRVACVKAGALNHVPTAFAQHTTHLSGETLDRWTW